MGWWAADAFGRRGVEFDLKMGNMQIFLAILNSHQPGGEGERKGK